MEPHYRSALVEITRRCNDQCLHCFQALPEAEGGDQHSEMTWKQYPVLIDQLEDCGITDIEITGGEPLIHPDFIRIVKYILERGLSLSSVSTNGTYVSQNLLQDLNHAACHPRFIISFDGLGYHDIIRGRTGAEEEALRAIELCVRNGFRVCVRMQVNEDNTDTIVPSLQRIEDIGADNVLLIRTSESPRWEEKRGNCSFDADQYFDAILQIICEYAKTAKRMPVRTLFGTGVFPEYRRFTVQYHSCLEAPAGNIPACRKMWNRIVVKTDGEILPCPASDAVFAAEKISFGNLFRTPLRELLENPAFSSFSRRTLGDLQDGDGKCATCSYFYRCRGGCRIFAHILAKADNGPNPIMCTFFEHGYPEKLKTELERLGYSSVEMVSIMKNKRLL